MHTLGPSEQHAWPLNSALAVKNKNHMNLDIEERKKLFEAFRSERLPVLHEFSTNLGFENPHEILLLPEKYLGALDEWLSGQEITEENKIWLATRIGYYLGEYFVAKYDGSWSVCEVENSKYYGHYVVGEFTEFKDNAIFNPIEAAMELANQPINRSLMNLVNEISSSLEAL